MKRLCAVMLVMAAAACAPADPLVSAERNWSTCAGHAAAENRIEACSAVIAATDAPAARRAAALVQRGVLRANEAEYGRAIADFGRALRLDATNTDALLERGRVHQERGAYDIAVRDYDAALALNPNLTAALEQRQAALSERGDAFIGQIEQLNRILERDPRNAPALNNRCWTRATNSDDLNQALADCDASLRIAPDSADTLDSRGLVHLKRGEFDLALADYNAALALEPGRGHYLYGRAIARQRLGQNAEAAADFVAAERAEPGVARAYVSYGVSPL